MIQHIGLNNFGPLANMEWSVLGKINLIIGGNSTGKTFLLKALYASLRTLEDYKRGNEPAGLSEILANKLYWTFQAEKIGDLVTKGAEAPLSSNIVVDGKHFMYTFGKDTTRQIAVVENTVPTGMSGTVFLPAKEVLSLYHVISKSREQDKLFGFDDTYLDLVRALKTPTRQGRMAGGFSEVRTQLKDILNGSISYEEASGHWVFTNSERRKFPIGATAEGIKKIAILDILLGNRYLNSNSVVCIDEPESALHPAAISKLMDIVAILASAGVQFFIATHSYFVIKKLHLIAKEQQWSIPVMSYDQQWLHDDLGNGMPDNPIIRESIELYWKEVALQ